MQTTFIWSGNSNNSGCRVFQQWIIFYIIWTRLTL